MTLDGTWQLWGFPQADSPVHRPQDLAQHPAIAAIVPGNAELDLARNGLLPEDLYHAENMRTLRAYEAHEWWYRREFEVTAALSSKNPEIVFGGLDCLATYWLDDEWLPVLAGSDAAFRETLRSASVLKTIAQSKHPCNN